MSGIPKVSIHDEFVQLMLNEYVKARKKWPCLVHYNQGVAVMAEEVLELFRDLLAGVPNIDNARLECLQVAAMAMAIYLELL